MAFVNTATAQIYVNTAASGMNNGTSWANAYTDLQSALASANPNDQIWIAQGTYSPGTATSDYYSIEVPGIQLFGGFNGTETMLSQRDFVNNETRLSGDVQGDDTNNDFTTNRSENNLHVMWVDDTITNTTIIDGLIIEHGNTIGASGSGNDRRAGGILCYGSPIIRNCIFTQNYGHYAGALYPRGTAANNILIEHCTFLENSASWGGGGIYLLAGGIVNDCTFDRNISPRGVGVYSTSATSTFNNCVFKVQGDGDTRGAGIYGNTGINVNNCTFQDNNGIWGCAIYATDVTNIDSCTFTNNSAVNNGGAMLIAFGAVATITNTTFDGNNGGNGGALYTQNDSTLLFVDNCRFFANGAGTGNGGAYYSLEGALAEFTNNEFELNVGEFGAAISFYSDDDKAVQDRLTLTNNVFKDNIANEQGGAINLLRLDSTFITNCLFYNNVANNTGTGGAISVNSTDTLPVYVSSMNNTFANNIGTLASTIAAYEDDLTLGEVTIVLQNTILHDVIGNNYAIEAGAPTVISNGGNLTSGISLLSELINTNDVMSTDPIFTNEANADFSLDPLSTCINSGVDFGAPTTDLYGTARFGVTDKGAIEYPFAVSNSKLLQTEGFDVFPNPVRETLNYSLENDYNGNVQFAIVNSLGQIVRTWTVSKNSDIINEALEVKSLAAGNYVLLAQFGNQQARQIVVKL